MTQAERSSTSHLSPSALPRDSFAIRGTKAMLRWIYRAPYLSLMLCIIVTLGAGMAGLKLKGNIRTKLQDLLPDHAPSVIASRSLSERLDSVDILVLTLLTDDFERVKLALPKLKAKLESLESVRAAEWRQDTELIERNALITFPTLDGLKEAYQDLRREIRKAVSERMSLFDDEGESDSATGADVAQVDSRLRKGLTGETRRLERALLTKLDQEDARSYAWGELENGSPLSDIGAQLRALKIDYPKHFHNVFYNTIGIKIYPTQPSNDLNFCQEVVTSVEREARALIEREIGPIAEGNLVQRLDLGGAYVKTLRATKKIKRDMFGSTTVSFGLLALTLLIAFRSLRGVICVLVPLVFGTVWALGFTALTIGYLNLITAFIFAVLLGLGIDFGIHFYGRFREERALGLEVYEAIERAHLSCGHASILAASTTSAAFFALTLADFRGLSQFGFLAAIGVLLCFLSVWVVLPTIVFIWERWSPLRLLGYTVEPIEEERARSGGIVSRLGGRVALIGLGVGLVGLSLAPLIEPELNFNNLKAYPKATSSLSVNELSAKRLQYGTTSATSPTVVFAESPAEAKLLQRQLRVLADDPSSHVKSTRSLYSLIPEQQPERIKWARKLCRKLKRKYKLFKGDARAGAETLLRHCDPQEFDERDLPAWVKAKFTDRQGVVGGFLFVSPSGSSSDGERAIAFHHEMQQIKTLRGSPPMVAGRSMVWAEILLAMRRDGALTFGAALILVLLILAALERSWRGLLFVSTPLILGLGCTVGAMVTLGIKLNFFNLLALPTLIGMGVDDGVHMHHRYRELGPRSASYIVRTTGRAALLTTLTTSIGFASLMLVDHRGLNSLGLLSVLGMSFALLATLLILPALFNWWDDRRARDSKLSESTRHSVMMGSVMGVLLCLSLLAALSCESSDPPGFNDPSATTRRDVGINTDAPLAGQSVGGGVGGGVTTAAGVTAGREGGEMGAGRVAGSVGAGATRGGSEGGEESTRCETVCDCEPDTRCVTGSCRSDTPDTPDVGPRYCCQRLPCPRDAACVNREGEEALCPVEACESACDCTPGFSCLNNACTLDEAGLMYCCERESCPAGRPCERASGMRDTCEAKPECASACDCFSGFTCEAGRCELPAMGASLVLCCDRDCSALSEGVECDITGGERSACP